MQKKNQIIFYNKKRSMKCFSVAATVLFLIQLLTGCSHTKSTTELYRIKDSLSKILYQNDWKLTFLYGTKVPSNSTAMLSFTPGDSMKVSGNTGCNSLSGHFELPGNAGLSFSAIRERHSSHHLSA